MDNTFNVTVVSPEELLYKGASREIIVPAEGGIMSILPRHAPLLTALKKGTVKILDGSSEKKFEIESGFIEVSRKEEKAPEDSFANLFVRTARAQR